jgi:hypothetical protein
MVFCENLSFGFSDAQLESKFRRIQRLRLSGQDVHLNERWDIPSLSTKVLLLAGAPRAASAFAMAEAPHLCGAALHAVSSFRYMGVEFAAVGPLAGSGGPVRTGVARAALAPPATLGVRHWGGGSRGAAAAVQHHGGLSFLPWREVWAVQLVVAATAVLSRRTLPHACAMGSQSITAEPQANHARNGLFQSRCSTPLQLWKGHLWQPE